MATVKATSVLRGTKAVKVLLLATLAALTFGFFLNLGIHEMTKSVRASGANRLPASSSKWRALQPDDDVTVSDNYRGDVKKSSEGDDESNSGGRMSSEIGSEDKDVTETSDMKRRLPKCLIVGFSNCWTMTLAGLLSLNPDIVTAEREIRYFTLNYQRGDEWYRSMMPLSTPSQITVERTPNYIVSHSALDRMYEFNSSMKIIAIVRDPIMRLMSTYDLHTRRHPDKPIFEHWCGVRVKTRNVLRYIDYATSIQNAIARFSRRNVLVLSKEDLETKPLTVLRSMESFLGVKPAFSRKDFAYNREEGATCFKTNITRYPEVKKALAPELDVRTGCLGSGIARRSHPNIDQKFLEQLLALIKIHNGRLFELINRRFNWTSLDDI
ncbi:heparan sulfate glucosamine 3-O-sulfotransferase 4 [Elysia marginata]|uniref:Heparan sulfate glucosamine 3-O-sulfotransferase 4 n=1 Tax=Elysia marginata TaxID=1093978 RepID=A0AAV4IHC7_9GAST|nr:heparan sulfate glucosamine 3-O-sulfotransferase 4 [Elysia marginata]